MSMSYSISKIYESGFVDDVDDVWSENVICVFESLYKKFTGKELPFIFITFDKLLEYENTIENEFEINKTKDYYNSIKSSIDKLEKFDNIFLDKLSVKQILKDIEKDNEFKINIDYLLEGELNDQIDPDDLVYYRNMYQKLKEFQENQYVFLCKIQ